MTISIIKDGNEISKVTIDGIELEWVDDLRVSALKSLLEDKKSTDLPEEIVFEIFYTDGDHNFILPYVLEKLENGDILVSFEELEWKKFYEGEFGLKLVMETKRNVIETSLKQYNIKLDDYEDEVNCIRLCYSVTTNIKDMSKIFALADKILQDVDSAAEQKVIEYLIKKYS